VSPVPQYLFPDKIKASLNAVRNFQVFGWERKPILKKFTQQETSSGGFIFREFYH